ncbi:MAG TPA: alpha/beta fold hydrolase [Allosphingosinicella sp.]|nr:alpha/beta fold hydrolase [Allosphingosinicella sp.]
MKGRVCLALLAALLGCSPAPAQLPADAAAIRARVEAEGEVRIGGGRLIVARYGFRHGEGDVEAVIVRPAAPGPHAGIVMVPGYSRTAWDMLPVALRLAREGFATVAVTQPGFGGSTGPADFVGPRTFAVMLAAAERFAAEPFVDRGRLGVYGYSRGGLAAAQLAARTDLFKAAVVGGGVYDFEAAYRQVPRWIAANMRAEAGTGAEAIRFRSPIHDMSGLDGPILIVHGAEDDRASPDQARALARRLATLGREHELVIVPGRGHGIGLAEIMGPAVPFFRRHLGQAEATGE